MSDPNGHQTMPGFLSGGAHASRRNHAQQKARVHDSGQIGVRCAVCLESHGCASTFHEEHKAPPEPRPAAVNTCEKAEGEKGRFFLLSQGCLCCNWEETWRVATFLTTQLETTFFHQCLQI
ncbi:uncharacterized protein LOC112341980 [Selaginella moellendorffii]|uniref:uncharacterized protein LOC112341980 n=1 Tax=Selaginella moellendorffii TaxID=88036 RepID=UPI000D1C5A33|nr:uncharacterized protein LOC112341980 [Selaginella moellendorffii]|eukprot:XP_024518803.1 uncharacterized protein LOC112341980 [Selaginella moellendorffii]